MHVRIMINCLVYACILNEPGSVMCVIIAYTRIHYCNGLARLTLVSQWPEILKFTTDFFFLPCLRHFGIF